MKVLINGGAHVHARDSDGATILHLSAHATDAMEFALDMLVHVNAKDNNSRTILHYLSMSHLDRNKIAIEMLERAGIDRSVEDCHGNTAAVYAKTIEEVIASPGHPDKADFEAASEWMQSNVRYPLSRVAIEHCVFNSEHQALLDNIAISAQVSCRYGQGQKWWVEEEPESP